MSAGQMKQAAALHQAGRLAEAEPIYRKILAADPQHADAMHLLGLLTHQRRDDERAMRLINQAIALRPGDANFHNSLGAIHYARADPGQASRCFRQAHRLQPSNLQAAGNLLDALLQQNALVEAENICRDLLARLPDQQLPDQHCLLARLARILYRQGRLEEALDAWREVLRRNPADAGALHNLGCLLIEIGRAGEGIEQLESALRLQPERSASWYRLGAALRQEHSLERAAKCFEKVLEGEPEHTDAAAGLADICEIENRLQEAAKLLKQTLERNPDHGLANIVAARCERRIGRMETALARLTSLPSSGMPAGHRIMRDYELALLYDQAKEPALAFDHARRANDQRYLALSPAERSQAGAYPAEIRRCLATFTPAWLDSWTETPPTGGSIPVFLVGFPRSGTTLLEYLLGRHEQVLTLPELQTVPAIKQAAAARIGQYPSGLAELDRQVIEQLRAAYFEEVARFADPGARLIIDKQPLNLVEAGLIYRVFPRAKFIFLLRHPADVCLSCFMQNFRSNPATISFLTLENTVNLYDVAMQAWRQFTRLLPLNVYTVRYELLIDQPAEALRRLGDFLDISAGLQVEEDDPPTLPRGIRTPSYHQVAEPINRRGLYRWQRYREQLGEAIEPLYPWMAALGYDQAALRESSE